MGHQQQNEQEYHTLLLLDTLKRLWSHYLHTAEPASYYNKDAVEHALEHEGVKQHWLQLLLFNFQFIDEQTLQCDDFKSFFSTIPEDICSYLLEQVYQIISAAKLLSEDLVPVHNAEDVVDSHVLMHKNKHNFAQLILNTPSDYNKIIALRSFLTHELGHHLLTFLLRVDIKLIASQKSLCQLCINLFPNCNWSNRVVPLEPRTSIAEFLNTFSHVNVRNLKTKKQHQHQQQYIQQQYQKFMENISTATNEDYEDFKTQTKTSDEIALLLIQLLTKCVHAERMALSTPNLSISVHNFALGYLCATNEADGDAVTEYADDDREHVNRVRNRNDEIIKFELLQLVAHCVHNFHSNEMGNASVLDFNATLSQLLYALIANRQHTQLAYGILYIMFGVLQNLVELLVHQHSHSKHGHKPYSNIDVQLLDSCFGVLSDLHERKVLSTEEQSVELIFTQIYKTLLRLTQNLARLEQQLSHVEVHGPGGAGGGGNVSHKPPRRKRYNDGQLHCSVLQKLTNIEQQPPHLYACYFQARIFTLLPRLNVALQEYSIRFLLRNGSCCCHYNLTNYSVCLQLVPQVSTNYQKCAYKFLHQHVLNTIFVRTLTPAMGQTKTTCANCDEKLKSQGFHTELLKLYEYSYKTIKASELHALLLYLKHLKHISHLLTYDLAAGIIAEVVLPIFRKHKLNVIVPVANTPTKLPKLGLPAAENKRADALRVLNECLLIFLLYLNDVRLIKAFYNEENIRHMEDLLSMPALQRGVCDLIKVGIDNITFLGDSSHEQHTLSRRLVTLQLNSSDRAAHTFHCLLARSAKRLQGSKYWLDEGTSGVHVALADQKPVDILCVTALQWTLNYELLKTSQLFYNEFAKIYSIVVEPDDDDVSDNNADPEAAAGACASDAQSEHSNQSTATISKAFNLKHGDKTIIDILKLNYNALNCFLMLPKSAAAKASATAQTTPAPTPTTSQPPQPQTQQALQHNANFCHSSSLEALLPTLPQTPTTFSSLAASTLTASSTSSSLPSLDYATITTHYTPEQLNTTTFLQRLRDTQQGESIVLFDIRQQQQQAEHESNATTEQSTTIQTEQSVAAAQQQHQLDDALSAGLIGKLFSIVGSFFGGSSRSSTDSLALTDDHDSLALYAPNGECKQLLLKLFEATMAICIKGYQNEEVEKMQKHLRKLRMIILSNAEANWTELAEQNARDNTVIQTLQTLLKIAELSHTLNEPAAVVSSSNLTTDEPSTTSTAAFNAMRPRARATANAAELAKLRINTQLSAKNTLATPPTPKRPISGDSCGDADYFSTRASVICADSELEFSENDNDYYLTADEGYEADGEIPEATDSECDITTAATNGAGGDLWHALQPTSRYRTHIMHDGLCRLVVEILIELSKLCVRNPNGWADSLAQLANRLYVIRDCLGGPLFLLRGFTPVLSCNDTRLRELQQSILELVTHLNTPEVLCTYFAILATKEPPMELLIKYMQHISASSLKKAQPSVELEFPVTTDGQCISTADRQITEHIDHIRNCHLQRQVFSPFTRAPCLIPVTHTRLWNNDGLTLSLWLEVKSPQQLQQQTQQQQTHRNSTQLNDDDTRCLGEDLTKTHIVSLGTNQAVLSIYVNNAMQLVVEMCKPSVELRSSRMPHTTTATTTTTTSAAPTATETIIANASKRTQAPTDSQTVAATARQATNRSRSGRQGRAETQNKNTEGNQMVPGGFRQALMQTKQVLFNSFSNMHFLNGHGQLSPSSQNNADAYFEISNVELKYLRLPRNKWTHLVFTVDNLPDRLELTIYADGLEQHTVCLPFRNFRTLTRTHSFQMLAVGDGVPGRCAPNQNSTSGTESRSTLDVCMPRLGIANLILFNRKIAVRDCILNLTALGPDFTEFTQCQVGNWKPNYGYLNLSKLSSPNFRNFGEAMKLLRQSRVLTYTAKQPDMAMCYDSSQELDNATYGRPIGLILYGELQQNELQTLQTSTILCGGLSTLVYLFAKVVEVCNNATTQALALDLLLSVAHSETQLLTEFQRNDYVSLISYVIKSERCSKDVHLLKSILNNACTQPLIYQKGEALLVNDNSIVSVVYPELIIVVLHRYSDWHRSGAEHSDVLDMLFRGILALTREKHPHRDFNMEQLQRAGLVKELLNICKIYVIESPNPVYISKEAAESFVQILSVFAGSPPAPSLLDEIMKLLLLLQKPSECYITHDRAKFYFLLSVQTPAKERSLMSANLSRVTTPFRRNLSRSRAGASLPTAVKSNNNTVASNGNAADVDAKRLERIKRLRRLHTNGASYKRALHEFEENLENVADCTKLNKTALRLLSPVETSRWRLKYKRQDNFGTCQRTHQHQHQVSAKSDSIKLNSQIIKHRRKRLRSCNAALEPTSPQLNGRHGLRSILGASLFTFDSDSSSSSMCTGAYTYNASMPRRSKALHKTDFYGSLGIMALQEGLLLLLKDFLCLLPDLSVDEVLKHYVKLEFMLVLANHSSCAVRAAIVRLLAALTKRLPQVELAASCKQLFPLHLANQLSIYPCDVHMFEACIAWITGVHGSLPMILSCETNLQIRQRFGLNALLAITTKTSASQYEFTESAFVLLRRLYINNPDDHQAFLEAGLLQCCVKALYNLYAPPINIINGKSEQAIIALLTTIGEKSLKSVGQINIVWDILNMLSFYQEKQTAAIVRNFRSVQALLQLNWIQMYFVQTNVPWSFNPNTFSDCALSQTECKTRLDMLIDRCAQFFTIFEVSYTPSDNELKLFEFLVSYGISTNQRCNNFIAWGLQPSRPRDLRAYIVDALWISCQDDFQPFIICDGKMIKALLWLSLLEDLEQPIEKLPMLCKSLGINENDSTWNLEHELERIELNRCNISAKQKSLLEKTIFKFEAVALNCIESSMLMTRRVAELQNAERKLLMSHMKDYDDTYTYAKWLDIIRRMTHEGAPWFNKQRSECSWELDDTEGPSRVHTRLRRCHLDIAKRFFMSDYSNGSSSPTQGTGVRDEVFVRPLEYLIASYDQQLNISLNSQILYNFPAKFMPVDGEIDGEIIITDHKLYFLATYRCKYFNVNCDIANITEIWLKRYQHQEKAFEIFLDTNKSLFFSLQNGEDWKIMRDVFCDKIVSTPDSSKVQLFTQQWREGLLTNWEYLMALNQVAGRTYNDLMQYPVFPWILSNYKSDLLDLTDAANFRKLERPIAVQSPENESHYINNYNYISSTITSMGSITLKPYHYSSHYSNSGTVLHFLVRVPPFTSYFLRYQDNNFDLPDRTFHALGTTWCLASHDSPTDVKELIPEFFCLPEMFENFERFNFGCRQSGERVEDVLLPNWCQRDARLFVLVHRQALESEFVRNQLHNWIDLIFGYKQTGEPAIEAINVFHPATYAVFLESTISDPIERRAVETMIKTYGQMPWQLFKSPHPNSKPLNYGLGKDKPVLQSVHGLRWGVYSGSPQLPPPHLGNIHKLPGAEYLTSFSNTNVVYGLPAKSGVMQGAEPDTYNVISWGYDDRIVRIQPLNKTHAKPKNLLHNSSFDDITACGCDVNSNQLWFGHKSGRISVYKCASIEPQQRPLKGRQSYARGLRLSYNSAFRKITTTSSKAHAKTETDCESDACTTTTTHSAASVSSASSSSAGSNDALHRDGADLSWRGATVLVRHTDEVTCIALSVEFKLAVTAGRDGIAVIWDLNDWSYVRTIERPAEIHHSPITHIAISPTLGDIVTVHTLPLQCAADGNDACNGSMQASTIQSADECFEVTEENLDDFVNVNINPNGKSILRLHSVNARYVQHIVHEDRILAVCYSYIKEGVGINVIATAVEGGVVRLWSSWNLSFVSEIVTGISNIRSITYSTHQHLVVLTRESHIQVWETDGLYGSSPKFPQIAYK